jgi:hypothetical protein
MMNRMRGDTYLLIGSGRQIFGVMCPGKDVGKERRMFLLAIVRDVCV